MPNLLHIIPIRHDTALDGVVEIDNALVVGLVANVDVLAGTADNGREHRPGCIVTRKAALRRAAAVVYDNRNSHH